MAARRHGGLLAPPPRAPRADIPPPVVDREGSEQNGRIYTTPALLKHVIAEVSAGPAGPGGGGRDQRCACLRCWPRAQIGKEPPQAPGSKWFSAEEQLEVAGAVVDVIRRKAEDFPNQVWVWGLSVVPHAVLRSSCRRPVCFLSATRRSETGRRRRRRWRRSSLTATGARSTLAVKALILSAPRSTQVDATPAERMQWHVDTAQFYLEVDDTASGAHVGSHARPSSHTPRAHSCAGPVCSVAGHQARARSAERNREELRALHRIQGLGARMYATPIVLRAVLLCPRPRRAALLHGSRARVPPGEHTPEARPCPALQPCLPSADRGCRHRRAADCRNARCSCRRCTASWRTTSCARRSRRPSPVLSW
jgi:hypothetical protein